MKNTAWIIGCGYVGEQLALRLRGQGQAVVAVGRDEAILSALATAGVATRVVDLDQREVSAHFPLAGVDLYYLAPPSPEGEGDARLDNFLRLQQAPRRIVYLSTTAVYAGSGGEWVTEETPVAPATLRGRKRLGAERALQQRCGELGIEWVILRVAGIYGQGRWPVDRLRQGLPVVREAESPYSNRIHVVDVATVCERAMALAQNGDVFNVSDGAPSTMSAYFKAVAQAFGLAPPPEIALAEAPRHLSPQMMSYLAESRRVSNQKMLDRLAITLRYPNLECALQDVRSSTAQV